MRALTVVSLLVLTAPALADTPPAPAPAPATATPPAPEAAAPPAPEAGAPPPADTAAPITPPALVQPAGEPLADPDEEEPPPTKYGYRWQVIGTDAAVVALSLAVDRIAANGNGRPDAIATLTIASYFFAAPMVHGIHRQGRRALASFGMRAGLPLLLGLLGEQLDGTPACETCEDTLRSEGKLIGLTAGVLISMAVDGALLARPIYRRTERAQKTGSLGAGAKDRPRTVWAPTLQGVRGGATAGVLGTF
jgi:hypothetical protein